MFNKDVLINIGIDCNKGMMYFGQDSEMYQKYLLDFAYEKFTETAIIKLKENDLKGAFKAVHSLKSLVEYVSIPRIDDIVHEITETLRAEKTEGVMVGLIFIKNATDDIKAEILKACN